MENDNEKSEANWNYLRYDFRPGFIGPSKHVLDDSPLAKRIYITIRGIEYEGGIDICLRNPPA